MKEPLDKLLQTLIGKTISQVQTSSDEFKTNHEIVLTFTDDCQVKIAALGKINGSCMIDATILKK